MPRGTQGSPPGRAPPFAYEAVTPSGRPFQALRLGAAPPPWGGPTTPGPPEGAARFGLLRVRSPLLAESLLFSLPPGTEMVHFPGFAPPARRAGGGGSRAPAGFPHSDTPGSKLACSSPRIFAAGRVLRRLLLPRHPPRALSSLPVRLAPGRPHGGRPGRRYSDGAAPPGAAPPAIAYDLRLFPSHRSPPRRGGRGWTRTSGLILIRDAL